MVIRISEELNKLEVYYEITDIDPQYSDTKEFCEKYSVNPENVVNSLLITSALSKSFFIALLNIFSI